MIKVAEATPTGDESQKRESTPDVVSGRGNYGNRPVDRMIFAVVIAAAVGLVVVGLYSIGVPSNGQGLSVFGVAVMLAGAALVIGGLLGLLFGIPRRL